MGAFAPSRSGASRIRSGDCGIGRPVHHDAPFATSVLLRVNSMRSESSLLQLAAPDAARALWQPKESTRLLHASPLKRLRASSRLYSSLAGDALTSGAPSPELAAFSIEKAASSVDLELRAGMNLSEVSDVLGEADIRRRDFGDVFTSLVPRTRRARPAVAPTAPRAAAA